MKENTNRMLIKQTKSCHLAGSLAEPEHTPKRMIIEKPAQMYRPFGYPDFCVGSGGGGGVPR